MLISGVRYAGERNHSVPERIESKQQRKSEIDFKELLDSEMKKLESPDRPKQNDSNTR